MVKLSSRKAAKKQKETAQYSDQYSDQGIARDISKRKEMEEILRESEHRYRTLFETMTQGVVYQAADGRIISANPSAERILGLTFDQMQGRTSADPRWKAIHEDGADFLADTHPSMVALKTGKEIRNVVMGVFNVSKGNYRWISINAVPQFRKEEMKPFQVYTTFEDITQGKEAEDARARLAAIVESTSDAIIGKSVDGTIISWNRGAQDMYGYAASEAIGRSISILALPDRADEIATLIEKLKGGEHIESFETVRVRKDGRQIHVSLTLSPIVDSTGTMMGISTIAHDITERKRMEEVLRQDAEDIKAMNEAMALQLMEKMSQIEHVATIGEKLKGSFGLSSGLDLILDTAMTDLEMDAGIVLAIDKESKVAKVSDFRSRIDGLRVNESYSLNEDLVEFEALNKSKSLSKIPKPGEPSILGTTGIHCVPILLGKGVQGILALGSRKDELMHSNDLAILNLYAGLASSLFATQRLLITPSKEVAGPHETVSELEPGFYLVKNDVEEAFEAFVSKVLSGAEGLCITRRHPKGVRKKYGLEKTPIVWLTEEKAEDGLSLHALQDLSILISNFLDKANHGIILLDGFEYLVTNNEFEPVLRFLQVNRNRVEAREAILITPISEKALSEKEAALIQREMQSLRGN